MKCITRFSVLLVAAALSRAASAQGVASTTKEGIGQFLQDEQAAVLTLQQAAQARDDTRCIAEVKRAPDVSVRVPPALATLRRVAMACTILTNENDLASAKYLALLALRTQGASAAESAGEQAEHLYWQAWLLIEIAGTPRDAVPILDAADAIAPQDDRLHQLRSRATRLLKPVAR